jgi:hypothetical protein
MRGDGMCLTAIVAAVLVSCGCGGAVAPSNAPALALLTIEASDSCSIGTGALPLKSYTVTMQDQRAGNDWMFRENRDPGGPRELLLIVRLQLSSSVLTGRIDGPAIITTQFGRMTVYPVGTATATTTATEVTGTLNGRVAAWLTDGGTYRECNASDHRFRLSMPKSP